MNAGMQLGGGEPLRQRREGFMSGSEELLFLDGLTVTKKVYTKHAESQRLALRKTYAEI